MDLKYLSSIILLIFCLEFVHGLSHTDIHQNNVCGGIVEGPAGVINYKSGENYTKYDACVWTIHAKDFWKVNLTLLNDGLNKGDSLQVFTTYFYTSDFTDRVSLATKLAGGNRNKTTVEGPLIYVVFGPYYSGTGFSLLFEGHEPRTTKSIYHANYKLIHENNEPSGNISYYKEALSSVALDEVLSIVISAPDKNVITSLSISNYETEKYYNLPGTGVWTNSLTVHNFQPGSPPNIFTLMGLYHSDDSLKTFKVNRPVVIFGYVRSEEVGRLEVSWTRENVANSTLTI